MTDNTVDEKIIAAIKRAFYKGFDKAKNDDGNCFSAWGEEAHQLIFELSKQQSIPIQISDLDIQLLAQDAFKLRWNKEPMHQEADYSWLNTWFDGYKASLKTIKGE